MTPHKARAHPHAAASVVPESASAGRVYSAQRLIPLMSGHR